ncbi:hypothetical protein BWGOE5_33790 [Bacillus mycoides]|nr:hypothetical protein BWGOE5_33790 [Bacillus mycoides]
MRAASDKKEVNYVYNVVRHHMRFREDRINSKMNVASLLNLVKNSRVENTYMCKKSH